MANFWCRARGHKREMHHLIDPTKPMWSGPRVTACGRCFEGLPS